MLNYLVKAVIAKIISVAPLGADGNKSIVNTIKKAIEPSTNRIPMELFEFYFKSKCN